MQNKELDYDLRERYGHEINDISNKLESLKKNRVYELSGVCQDGSLCKNIEKLENSFNDLLNKIQNGEKGFQEEISKYFE